MPQILSAQIKSGSWLAGSLPFAFLKPFSFPAKDWDTPNHLLLLAISITGYWSESEIFLEFYHKYKLNEKA